MEEVPVATAFVRHDGEVLAVRRAEDAPTFPGLWGGVSAEIAAGENPVAAARREVREAVGLEALVLVRTGEALWIESPGSDAPRTESPDSDAPSVESLGSETPRTESPDGDTFGPDATFAVHPVLFDAPDREVALAGELVAAEWLSPTALLRRETVPRSFETYLRVAPTVRSVAADDEHGAATLSIRALEVLRDRAGLLASEGDVDLDELRYLADRLREARPSMAVLRNRVNRALAESGAGDGDASHGEGDADAPPGEGDPDPATPADVERAAVDGITRALAADAGAATRAAGLVSGTHVLTLSRSSTVLDALRADTVAAVSIAESRPAREGVDVAEALVAAASDEETADDPVSGDPVSGDPVSGDALIDAPVTIHTDAAIAHRLATADVDAVLVGADAILPDGRVVNKTGTRGAAIAAAREGIPVYVAAATDKVTTREAVNLESGDAAAVYDGDAPLSVVNPTFDVTPADAIAGVVTERGVLDADEIAAVAAELRAFEPE